MKAGTLATQLLDLPADTEVVIDGGRGVGELPIRWSGFRAGESTKRFSICVVVPPSEAALHSGDWLDREPPAGVFAIEVRAMPGGEEGTARRECTGWRYSVGDHSGLITPGQWSGGHWQWRTAPPPTPEASTAWLKTPDMDAIEDWEAWTRRQGGDFRRSGFNRLNIGGAIELTVWPVHKTEPVRYTSTAQGEWTQTHPVPEPPPIPRGESKTVRLVVNGGPAVEYVHPDEHERVRSELAEATRDRDARYLRCMDWRDWVVDLSGVKAIGYGDDKYSDRALRLRLHEHVEQRGRDLSEVERRERERVETERDNWSKRAMTTERQRDALQANLNEWRVWAKGHAGMDLPGDSDEDIRGMLSDRLMDGVSLDEHERVKAAAKKVLRSRDHLDAVQLQWERWARDLSGLPKASPDAVRAKLSGRIDSLAEYRELAMDIGDVKDHGTPDAELRAAVRATLSRGGICLNEYTRVVQLLAEYREMCRDVIGVERSNFTDAELRAALVAETEQMAREAVKAGRMERMKPPAEDLGRALWVKGEPEDGTRVSIKKAIRPGATYAGAAERRGDEWWVAWPGRDWHCVGGWGADWERRSFPGAKNLTVDS